MEYWGYHLILDCKNGDLEKVKSADTIKNFVQELVKEIDMVASGAPNIKHFATHNDDAAGYSLVQLIETSSILTAKSDILSRGMSIIISEDKVAEPSPGEIESAVKRRPIESPKLFS